VVELFHDLLFKFSQDTYISDPSGPVNPVNSCIFAAVLYFPVFCTILSCVYSFFMKKM